MWVRLGWEGPLMPVRHERSPGFGRWLREKRGSRSYETLAELIRPYVRDTGLQMNRSFFAKLEAGRIPNWPTLGALAKVLGIPVREMVSVLVLNLEFPGAETLLRAPWGAGAESSEA